MTKSIQKKHLQEVLSLSFEKIKKTHKLLPAFDIIFSSPNLEGVVPGHDDPMIILAVMVNGEVKRIFVDQGSSADIIFQEVTEFSGEKVHPNEFVTLHLTLGTQPRTRTIKVDFLVVNRHLAYNVILGRPTLNKIRAIISIACLTMKFFIDNGEIAIVRVDQAVVHCCYTASL